MNKDDKAIAFLNSQMLIGLAINVVGVGLAALFGLTNPEGPTVISLLILAGAITTTGGFVYRGVVGSKRIAQSKQSGG